MNKIAYRLFIPFSIDRAGALMPPEWVEDRIKLFESSCLKSILNAEEHEKFRIWLICGNHNKAVTDAHKFHPMIDLVYDNGSKQGTHHFIKQLKEDYLSISRIDSDDLYHKTALKRIIEFSESHCNDRINIACIHETIDWDKVNWFIRYSVRPRPPFITKVLPRESFQNPNTVNAAIWVSHGQLGGNIADVDLTGNLVCVIKHDENISNYTLRGQSGRPIKTLEEKEELLKSGKIASYDKEKIKKLIKEYGI